MWPQANLDEATALYAPITPQKLVYEYGTTRLTRQGYSNGTWEFLMEYLLVE